MLLNPPPPKKKKKTHTHTHTKKKKTFPTVFKGGHLDFSHLTELKNKYKTEIYMQKQYKSLIHVIMNHRITKKKKKK